MSWKASAWAKEQRLGSPAAKAILLCLADYADAEKAACWPSQEQLSQDAEVSERTTREWLQRLEDWGLIARTRRTRRNGARAADMIVLKLDVSVLDGVERCRSGKGSDAAVTDGLPAESAGRTNRQPDADLPEVDDTPTGNQFRAYKEEPPIEPTSRTSQRAREGARERDDLENPEDGSPSEDPKSVERAFWRVVKDWPGFAGMPKKPAMRPWFALTADERADAERKRDRWFALLKSQGKRHVPAPSTYFSEKLWKGVVLPEERAPENLLAKPWGALWGLVRVKQFLTVEPKDAPPMTAAQRRMIDQGVIDADEVLRERQARYGWPVVNAMHERAANRQGVSVAPALQAFAGLMEPVPVGSERWEEWKLFHGRKGWPWLPNTGEQRVVYFPAGGPGGLKEFQTAIGANDAGTSEAAE